MKRGDKVKFNGCSEAQQKWGSYDDHSKLVIGEIYTVSKIEKHSWHTNVHLKGINGKFNSVCFTVEDDGLFEPIQICPCCHSVIPENFPRCVYCDGNDYDEA